MPTTKTKRTEPQVWTHTAANKAAEAKLDRLTKRITSIFVEPGWPTFEYRRAQVRSALARHILSKQTIQIDFAYRLKKPDRRLRVE